MTPKPHVSPALAHLRSTVAVCAIAVAVCAGAQLLVFGFLHFTHLAWTTTEGETREPAVKVVSSPKSPSAPFRSLTRSGANEQGGVTGKADFDAKLMANAAVIVPARVPSTFGVILSRTSALACTAGIIAAIALALLTFKGVVIAAGGGVPGVEKAVTASTWALLLALLCLPLHESLSLPIRGVFVDYRDMLATSDTLSAGKGSLMAAISMYVLLPIAALVTALVVMAKFAAGVERGVILTSVSELDEAVDREMAVIRATGVSTNYGGKMVGVLNRAIGDVGPADAIPGLPRADPIPIARQEPLRPSGTDDSPFKRPI